MPSVIVPAPSHGANATTAVTRGSPSVVVPPAVFTVAPAAANDVYPPNECPAIA